MIKNHDVADEDLAATGQPAEKERIVAIAHPLRRKRIRQLTDDTAREGLGADRLVDAVPVAKQHPQLKVGGVLKIKPVAQDRPPRQIQCETRVMRRVPLDPLHVAGFLFAGKIVGKRQRHIVGQQLIAGNMRHEDPSPACPPPTAGKHRAAGGGPVTSSRCHRSRPRTSHRGTSPRCRHKSHSRCRRTGCSSVCSMSAWSSRRAP